MPLSSSALNRRILKRVPVGDYPFRLPLKRSEEERPDEEAVTKPEELLAQARAEAEEIRRRAYEEGRHEGYREGLAQARAEAEAIRQRARNVLREAEATRRRILDELEPELRELAVEIAEKIVARQLELQPDSIAAVAREALTAVRDRESVVIYVHPSQLLHLQRALPELQALLPENASVRIIGDADLKTGGVLVETERGLVDATVDVRWRQVLKALE